MVALLLQSTPALSGNVGLISDIVQQSASPLYSSATCTVFPGNQRPNSVYGYGRIDALAAVQLAATQVSAIPQAQVHPVLQLYPNPFSDYLIAESKEYTGPLRIELYDSSGRLHLSQVVRDQVGILNTQLSPGLYFYRVWQQGKVVQSGKLIGR
jgi:hypothetical protein